MAYMFSRYVQTPSPVQEVFLILDLLLLNKILLLQITGLYHTSNFRYNWLRYQMTTEHKFV